MELYETITIEYLSSQEPEGLADIARVTLNRPKTHNAFDDLMIRELNEVYANFAEDKNIRVIILRGSGRSFSAGADLNWMQRMKNFTFEENLEDAQKLSDMLYRLYNMPQVTIAAVNGPTIGGGTGLAAVNDLVIASEEAYFSLSEVKLGLVPACISPYVFMRLQPARYREYFLTGKRFSALEAYQWGFCNEVIEPQKLDETALTTAENLMNCGPNAICYCKELFRKIPTMDLREAGRYTAKIIAELRVSPEGQEGMAAFFEKRKPDWAV